MLRTGDMARHLGETEVTVRYWCDQFKVPVVRGKGGQRMYGPNAHVALSEVRRLLRTEGFTVEGAKKKLGIT